MRKGLRGGLLPIALHLLALVPSLRAQAPFPAPGADPAGKVLDENGKPIAGANVELRVDLEGEGTWANAIAQVLSATPLPEAISDKDGDYVLPLTPFQRSLGALGEGSFWLVVRKPGRRTWTEPLPYGLRGYLGSRVVLPNLPEPDPLLGVPWPPVVPATKPNEDGFQTLASAVVLPKTTTRRPGPPVLPAVEGTTKLVMTVKDSDGKPVPGAILRFSDGWFAKCRAVGAQPWVSDENGVVTIDGFGKASGKCAAIAEGFAAKVTNFAVGDEDKKEVTLALERTRLFSVTLVDASGTPIPFASLSGAVAGAAVRAQLRNQSDSLGRVRVELPATERATLYAAPILNAVNVGPESAEAFDVQGATLETWFVRTAPVRGWTYSFRTQRQSLTRSNNRVLSAGVDALLVRAPVAGTTKLELRGGTTPPVTIDETGGRAFDIAGHTIRVFDLRLPPDTQPTSRKER